METKIIACVECGSDFDFGASEAAFYQRKGLAEPKRCAACRKARKATLPAPDGLEQLLLERLREQARTDLINGLARIIANAKRDEDERATVSA